MLNEALKLHKEYGWSIMPIFWIYPNGKCACGKPNCSAGKHPILGTWKQYQEKRADEDWIRNWWERYPDANIAVITGSISDLLVVDCDDPNSSIRYDTLTSKTGGGGHHYFFKLDGMTYGNKTRIAANTDVRCEGGYVVVPPSNHATGNCYEWENSKPIGSIVPEVKRWLSGSGPVSPTAPRQSLHEEGTRNDTIMREVCSLLGKGLSPQETFDRAKKFNLEWCFPPLTEEEVLTIVKSIWNNAEKPKRLRAKPQYRKEEKHPEGQLVVRSTETMLNKYGSREQEWIIPHWLPSATCCVVGAPPGTYKTWFMIDLAVSLTTGKLFLGKYPVGKTGPVIFAQQEDNITSLMERLCRLVGPGEPLYDGNEFFFPFLNFKEKDMPIWADSKCLHVENDRGMADLEMMIEQLNPIAVIIDPFFSFVPLADDYGVKAAQIINSKLKPIRDRHNTTFIFSHHTHKGAPQSEVKGGRKRDSLWGSQFINAGLETAWHLRAQEEGGNIITIQRHTKVAGYETDVSFELRIDDWGMKILPL